MRTGIICTICAGLVTATGPAGAAAPASVPEQTYDAAWLAGPTPNQVFIDAGKGQMIDLPQSLTSIIAVDPKVVRVQPVSRTSFYLMGLDQGATTVVALDSHGKVIEEYAVFVRTNPFRGGIYDPVKIKAAISAAIRGADNVHVVTVPNGVILTGTVATPDQSQQVMAVARAMVGEKMMIINKMDLLSSIQVNVRVRFIEVSRQVTQQLGINWQSLFGAGKFAFGLASGSALGALIPGAAATQSLADLNARTGGGSSTLTGAKPSRLTSSFDTGRFDVNAVIDALAENQLITVLAEPNLTALSGETASFLAGGEFPIPVSANSSGQVTIEFKQFGVSLSCVPTVLSPDRLNLRVRPEVSQLTDAGSISMPLAGGTVKVPALSVRRAETTVELASGQSFAIAGLLQNSSTRAMSGVPGLSSLPVIGQLFRSKNFRNDRSELVIIVTPYLVRPASSDQLVEPGEPSPPVSANDQNLRAMLENPADLRRSDAQPPVRGDGAAGAVKALLEGNPKPLINPAMGSVLTGGGSGKP